MNTGNESETPRTDAEASDGWTGDAVCVSADFARTLERELAEAKSQLAKFAALCSVDSESAMLAAMERDKAREELAEAQHRIRLLISERDTARGFLSIRKSLCDELKALLGTEDVAEGVARIKEMQARIAELEANQCEGEPFLTQRVFDNTGDIPRQYDVALYRKKNHE